MNTLECEAFLQSQGINRDLKQDYWEWSRGCDWRHTLHETEVRWKFIQTYGFAILHQPAIEAIRPYAPLLEIGAGSGYWSYELQKHGIDIIATDSETGKYGFWGKDGNSTGRWKNFYTDIQTIDCRDAIRKYPNRNILTVWPDYDAPWAYHAIRMFTGKTVIYMGEGHGNCTADDNFHEYLDSEFSNQILVPMPHFWGNYDRDLVIASRPKQL